MKRTFSMVAALVLAMVAGCGRDGTGRTTSATSQTQTERTTTTQSAPAAHTTNPPGRGANVNVDLDGNDRAAAPANGTVAGQDRVNVNTTPGGGVNVDVKGQPARDLIRERREARREGTIPR